MLIHSPHRRTSSIAGRVVWSESNREIATLNINQTITALVAGLFLPNEDKEVLIIGKHKKLSFANKNLMLMMKIHHRIENMLGREIYLFQEHQLIF